MLLRIPFLILVCRNMLIENVYAWWSPAIFQMLSLLNFYHLQKYNSTETSLLHAIVF